MSIKRYRSEDFKDIDENERKFINVPPLKDCSYLFNVPLIIIEAINERMRGDHKYVIIKVFVDNGKIHQICIRARIVRKKISKSISRGDIPISTKIVKTHRFFDLEDLTDNESDILVEAYERYLKNEEKDK